MSPRTASSAAEVAEGDGGPTDELPEAAKGRGACRVPSRKAGPAKKPKGRTVYLSDDLFERIIVQAHRRDKTISEYVSMILERQVPDHRFIRADSTDEAGAA
ncbi:MAG TPA: hypothetical protein VKP69_10915 [Isosphaeraceae bacterium]|nr:hypothetical protein [Isosphaeraceae bacterium]